MRARSISLVLAGLAWFLLPVCAQTSPDNLPAAPSATVQQEQQQARAKAQVAQAAAAAQQAKDQAAQQAKDKAAKDAAAKNASSKDSNGSASPAPTNNAQAPQKSSDHGVDGSLLEAGDGTASDTTITRRVNEVNWVFTVMDRHGRYVKDLKKEDFSVLDNDRPVNRIRSFQNETDLPLQVGLLIDASNSIRERFKFEQESAIEFLNDTIRRKYDKAFVIGFDVAPEVTQDFTDDAQALSQGIRVLRPGGGTALFDALYFACRDKLMKEPHPGPVRKAIILLTDGDDNQSHVTREEAIEMAQRAEVVVYTISTNLTDKGGEGDRVLQRIADATGGRSYTPFQLTDVADAFGKIQDELRSQYSLSFRPPEFNPDGSFHTVQILAKNHKGLRIRGRHGYYAPNE
ncbi:MAG TPA: VWA domain-containing protein [Terriglobales bacterium]